MAWNSCEDWVSDLNFSIMSFGSINGQAKTGICNKSTKTVVIVDEFEKPLWIETKVVHILWLIILLCACV